MIRSTKKLSREYLCEFLADYDYPEEARVEVLANLERLLADDGATERINALLESFRDKSFDFVSTLASAKEAFEMAGVGEYEGNFIYIAHLASGARDVYRLDGHTDEIWFDIFRDLKYKINECHTVHGVWGNFVPTWYRHFTSAKIFSFGRLQFEETLYSHSATEVDGVTLEEGTPVLSVHIPTTGTPLDRASFTDAYRRAAEFFRQRYFGGGKVIFVCRSWLLYPRHKELLRPGSNIVDFASDYTIVESGNNGDYSGHWRVFDCKIDPERIQDLPEDNSMRRAYKGMMQRGEPTGWGNGVIVWKD